MNSEKQENTQTISSVNKSSDPETVTNKQSPKKRGLSLSQMILIGLVAGIGRENGLGKSDRLNIKILGYSW